ncbi:MAG: cation diffusion facilitator family transporter [Chloroflexota bacterium]
MNQFVDLQDSRMHTKEETERRHRRSQLAVNLGLVINVLLAGLKTTVGILGHSPALLAEGINSTSDVAYYLVVWVFMRMARKPADEVHPYGHSQLESISSLVVGAFIMTTGVAVFWDAINAVFDLWAGQAQSQGARAAALWIALGTVAVKLYLTWFTRKLGRESGSPAVGALAYDHRNDVMSASAAALGIFLGRQGYPWVDPMVGALVALLIFRTGVEILRQSSADLMDAVPGSELHREITGLLERVEEIECIEEIHTHRFGPYLVVNLTIGIDGSLSVAAGDCISTQVENLIYERMDLVRKVYVHYHPSTRTEPCYPIIS